MKTSLGFSTPDLVSSERSALTGRTPDGLCQMSRAIVIRPAACGLVVESLLTGRCLELTNPSQMKLFLAFARPIDPDDLVAAVGHERSAAVRRFIARCLALQLLVRVRPDGTPEEEDTLIFWEPHDLYFHVRSRRGQHPYPVGATFHLAGVVPVVPALQRETPPRVVALERPAADAGTDPGLLATLDRRRSRYSVAAVDRAALSAFLYRTFRVTASGKSSGSGSVLKKVYPSGGSLHSLELYLVANRCPGLDRDVYRYRALTHDLVPLERFDADVEALLRDAQQATGGKLPDLPSILFIFSTRFGRVASKYQSLAYSVVLKEVGALFQTMYLVATAMELAPCALGSGDSVRFARVTGTHSLEETSVGEFILGGAL